MTISEAAQILKYDLDFQTVSTRYGLNYRRGSMTCCPFHGENKPSFSAKGNRGKCFACGWSGDFIDFVEQTDGLSYSDTVKRIADDFGYNFDFDAPIDPLAKRKEHECFLKRKREREQTEKRIAVIEDRLDFLYRVLRLYEQWIDEYTPECVTDGLSTRYAEAVSQIDKVRYDIDCSESELQREKEKLK